MNCQGGRTGGNKVNCERVNVGGVVVKGIWWAKEWRWMGNEGVVCIQRERGRRGVCVCSRTGIAVAVSMPARKVRSPRASARTKFM